MGQQVRKEEKEVLKGSGKKKKKKKGDFTSVVSQTDICGQSDT